MENSYRQTTTPAIQPSNPPGVENLRAEAQRSERFADMPLSETRRECQNHPVSHPLSQVTIFPRDLSHTFLSVRVLKENFCLERFNKSYFSLTHFVYHRARFCLTLK